MQFQTQSSPLFPTQPSHLCNGEGFSPHVHTCGSQEQALRAPWKLTSQKWGEESLDHMYLDFSSKTKNSMLLLLPPGEQRVRDLSLQWSLRNGWEHWGVENKLYSFNSLDSPLRLWSISTGTSAGGQENSNCQENLALIFTRLSLQEKALLYWISFWNNF